jgi:hypothetical protein
MILPVIVLFTDKQEGDEPRQSSTLQKSFETVGLPILTFVFCGCLPLGCITGRFTAH